MLERLKATWPWPGGCRFICLLMVYSGLLSGFILSVTVVNAQPCPPGACDSDDTELPARAYLPSMLRLAGTYQCPVTSALQFDVIWVDAPPADRPAPLHADLNLALRGYQLTQAFDGLVDYNGDTDGDAPQLTNLFVPAWAPVFRALHRVNSWVWGTNSRGAPLVDPEVTLVMLASRPGQPVRIPSRRSDIMNGVYRALVLYAEPQRITLKYTRDDNVISGYTVHLEWVCVDPNLLRAYEAADRAGRGSLPALRNTDLLGVAAGSEIGVAVRDTGDFMDPRSRKDWWQGIAADGLGAPPLALDRPMRLPD